MAMLDQLLGLSPWGGSRPTFEQAFPVPASDETAAVEEAAEAAARRQRRGVIRYQPTPMSGEEIPGMGLMESVGLLSGRSPAATPEASFAPTQPAEQLPPSTNDPQAREPEVFSGGVPIPRPRPVTPNTPASVGPTDLSSSNAAPAGAPLSLAPPAPDLPRSGGGLGGILGGILKPENAPLFLSLAGGLSGAPSLGTGMRRAFAGATPAAMLLNKERTTTANQRETFEALKARGVPPHEALAALRNPEMMKALISKYFETGKAQVTDGVAWRENPKTGQVEIIKDFGTTKAPSVQEFKTPEGDVKRQWNAKTQQWEVIPGFEKPSASRDQRLTFSNIKEMSEQGGKFKQIQGFGDTFKPEYAGYMSETVGDLANTAARNLPMGKAAQDRASWWQNYQSFKNTVRNDLFGSALTKTEATEFIKADIHPGMQPEVIKRNIARQQELADLGMRRTVDALVKAGYSREAVETAFGVSGPRALGAGDSTVIDGVTIRRVK